MAANESNRQLGGMPRRKKNGQSPARVPGGPPEGGNTGYRLSQGFDGAMANNFSSSLTSTEKEAIVKSMQEVFSHLDPEVIYIVLSECDFKVENAMDSFLELSVAAEDAAPAPSPVSGFERTAAALLGTRRFSEPRPDPDSSQQPELLSSPSSANVLSEELDLLVDQELETLTARQNNQEEHQSSQYLSSFPPPPFSQQVLPELLQSSLQPGSRGPSGGPVEHVPEASSPLDQLSTWEDNTAEQQQQMMVDFTHLTAERPADGPKPPLDLSASGRPSAFQVYKKQDSSHTDSVGLTPSEATAGGARSKLLNQENLSAWNVDAEVFSPHVSNLGPTFITPVAQTPPSWPSHPRLVSPWLSQGPVSQAPLKPSATIPKSWAMPASQQQQSRLRLQGRVLVLLRGAPGSGKSTLARALVEHNPGGIRLSTDDYFFRNGDYQFDPAALGEAHEWNHKRAKEAFERGANPIIIDNTNMQGWEMRPYVVQALKHGYKVLFREPDTWWKNKPRELQRRTTHNVPVETIRRMLNGYERFVTVKSIMGSQMPEFKQQLLLENQSRQPVSSEAPCPDLVGQPGLTEGSKETHPQLYSSLPDVSSIGRYGDVGMLEDGAHQSTESLNFQPTATFTNNPEMSDEDIDLDFGELDSELDAQLELNHPMGDQRIPDCIVESVMNSDHHRDELPVAFSESIGQRVRRQRPNRRSEPADLLKDTSQSDSEAKEEDADRGEVDKSMPEMLDFVGDWPSERSLGQRQARRRERHKEGPGQEGYGVSQDAKKNKTKPQSGPDVTEFQKLLDLIQTGAAPAETSSSRSSSISSGFGQELEKEEEAGGRFEDARGSRSNSEEREQNTNRVNNSRGELPDCVLDWRAAESSNVREPSLDRVLKTENDGNDNVLEISRGTELAPLAALIADSLVISKPVEENTRNDGPETLNYEAKVGTDLGTGPNDVATSNNTDNSSEARAKADDSHTSEGGQSPVCGISVEADSSALSGGSQERKQRQGRRSGKQFKLAFTSTQNCPASSLNTPECPSSTAQNINSSPSSINTDVEPNFRLSSNTSLDPNSEESKSETHPQPPSPLPLVGEGGSSQTEPQDFALLWRLNRQNSPDQAVGAECSQPSVTAILSGDSSRFVPGLPSDISAGHPPGHREVPYRVVHEKGTQVEEKELGAARGRLECLRILSCHFKLVSFDTLEDLYDKCHQDLEWTINLLLDSGERFFRDEDGENEEWDGARGEEDQTASSLCGALAKSVESKLHPDVLDEHHLLDLTRQSTFGAVGESDQSSENADGHPDTTSHIEKSPFTVPNLLQTANEEQRCGDTEHKVLSAAVLGGGAYGGSFDDAVIIEESRIEIEEEIASMDEVNRLLQAELDKMEREERQKEAERAHRRNKTEGRSHHVDIQSVELKLPTEVALQLTELFGPVGIDPGKTTNKPLDIILE